MNNKSSLGVLVVLTLSIFAVARQQGPTPPGGTPTTFPPGTSAPNSSQKTDPEQSTLALTSQELKIRIVKKLQTQPGLNSRKIHVKVSRDVVSLRGSVPSDKERTMAEAIAKSFAGNRRIDNRLGVDR